MMRSIIYKRISSEEDFLTVIKCLQKDFCVSY
jgi:hypothetical protein